MLQNCFDWVLETLRFSHEYEHVFVLDSGKLAGMIKCLVFENLIMFLCLWK